VSIRRLPLGAFSLLLMLAIPRHASAQSTPWYERIRFAGDFRLRSESFLVDETPDRTRLRVRLRLGATAPLGDDFTVGFRLATGIPGVVTSANVNLGDAFTTKNLAIDRAYITWRPNTWLSVSGGKIGMPLWRPDGVVRSQLMFDEEVAPEGFHEAFTILSRKEGLVRGLVVNAEQWMVREVSSGSDSWFLGGQGVLDLAVAPRVGLALSGAYLAYTNSATLARLAASNQQLLMTNRVITRSGAVLDGGSPYQSESADPFDRYDSEFRMVQAAAGLTGPRIAERPFTAFAEWVHNTGATSDRDGIWAGIGLGETRSRGDWSVGLAWARLEQEAVMSMFSYSDLGFGGTNVQGPIIQLAWRPVNALTLGLTDHLIQLVRKVPDGYAGTLHRLQIDGRVSF